VLALLGVDVPASMEGRPIELSAAPVPSKRSGG
jgi:hypothetical protein